MSLWDKVTSWFEKDGVHFVAHPIPKSLVDVAYDDAAIPADRGYLRVWLVDMFLAKSRKWFRDWQPAVQGRVKLAFADQNVELMRLAAPSSDKFKTDQSVLSNYVLLDLVPFRGGLVEIEVALLALQGADRLGAAISVLAGFADLVVAPLGRTLEVATKVKEGITTLFADSDEVHLAAHNTFGGTGGANQLRAGYLAVIGAPTRTSIAPSSASRTTSSASAPPPTRPRSPGSITCCCASRPLRPATTSSTSPTSRSSARTRSRRT